MEIPYKGREVKSGICSGETGCELELELEWVRRAPGEGAMFSLMLAQGEFGWLALRRAKEHPSSDVGTTEVPELGWPGAVVGNAQTSKVFPGQRYPQGKGARQAGYQLLGEELEIKYVDRASLPHSARAA